MKSQFNVLIVEDEFIVANNIKQQVLELGYNIVDIANDAKEVFQIIDTQNVDLVLMDVMLQGSIDGIEIAKIIKEQHPISFVFITAYSSDEYFNRARLVEPHGYLLKPFTQRDLAIHIELAAYKHSIEKKLRVAKSQLELLNIELEDKIEERTAKLVESNQLLLLEIEKRKENEKIIIDSEHKILESERFLNSINNSAPIIIFIYNLQETKVTYINQQSLPILGYLPEEIIGIPISELKKNILDYKEATLQFINKQTNQQLNYSENTIKFKHKQLGIKILNVRFVNFKTDESGNILELIGSAIDITEQKQNERRLNAMIRLNRMQDKRTQKIRTLSLIEGQEDERRRISRDIHDGIGQMLTALKLNLENFNESNFKNKLELVKNITKETILETRRISNALAPPGLYDFGLYSVTKQLLDQLSNVSKIKIHFDSNIQNIRFPSLVEVTLYRIIQESINNVLKHANAMNLEINLNQDNEYLNLIIFDDGVGFSLSNEENNYKKQKGNGFKNIKDRALFIGANLNLISKPNEGFIIKIKVPIKNIII